MDTQTFLFFSIIGITVLSLLAIAFFYSLRKNPFRHSAIVIDFDVTGKRQPNYDDYIDEWLIELNKHQFGVQVEYSKMLKNWEAECEAYLERCLLKSHRRKQYETTKLEFEQENNRIFLFVFSREQTRYRQSHYIKEGYTVQTTEKEVPYSIYELIDVESELRKINFETTRSRWRATNQRRQMTKELKDRIKARDNYTCQICGKYMPDEVGLHIDHIIPIRAGGKSVESNLQVLCDKCNLSKGKKY